MASTSYQQPQAQPAQASKVQAMANAIFALIMACLFVVAFFGFAVYYIVNAVEDRAALTAIFCFIGLAVFAAVCAVAGFGLYYVRNLGGALVEHQSRDNQAIQTAFVQLVAETRKTNEINQQLLNAAMSNKQLPAPSPAVTTGTGSFVLRDRGREVTHTQQPAQPSGWLYQLPDGRKVRGDLIEAIADHQFDEYDSKKFPDFRSYLHEYVDFGHTTYRSAIDALEREGVCDSRGTFKVTQDEAWRIVALMQSRARVPAEVK